MKERRRLVLALREAPLSDIHLENMLKLSRMGAVVMPPVPAFYTLPQSVDDIVDHTRGAAAGSLRRGGEGRHPLGGRDERAISALEHPSALGNTRRGPR